MSQDLSGWPSVSVFGPIDHRPGARFSAMRDVHALLSRRPPPEWQVLFEEALRTDPADRDATGIRAGSVPMVWATVTPLRAETIDDAIYEAVEVANLRYRTQWLPTLPAAEVLALIADASVAERNAPPAG